MFRPILLVSLLAIGCVTGCAPTTGTVSGTVEFEGAPVDFGLVTISPLDPVGGTAGGEINKGEFKVANVTPGKYNVQVEVLLREPKIINPGDPETKRKLSEAEMHALSHPLPAGIQGTSLQVEVKAGEQTLTFELKSPPTGRRG